MAASAQKANLPSHLKKMISRTRIKARVEELGAEVSAQLKARDRPVAVVVLQGAFVFAADLLRRIPPRIGLEIAFLRCESYGNATKSKGNVMILQDLDAGIDLRNRTVLLIDDILDTGLTLETLAGHMRSRGARTLLTCVLLQRKERAAKGLKADFVGFYTGSEFFVGYGLDHAGKHRNLPDLAALKKPPQIRKGTR